LETVSAPPKQQALPNGAQQNGYAQDYGVNQASGDYSPQPKKRKAGRRSRGAAKKASGTGAKRGAGKRHKTTSQTSTTSVAGTAVDSKAPKDLTTVAAAEMEVEVTTTLQATTVAGTTTASEAASGSTTAAE
jgi:hypothetical protein